MRGASDSHELSYGNKKLVLWAIRRWVCMCVVYAPTTSLAGDHDSIIYIACQPAVKTSARQ